MSIELSPIVGNKPLRKFDRGESGIADSLNTNWENINYLLNVLYAGAAAEVIARTAVDVTLTDAIADEADNRGAAVSLLEAADTALGTRITNEILAEETAREFADTALGTRITTEILAEGNTRANAYNALFAMITAIQNAAPPTTLEWMAETIYLDRHLSYCTGSPSVPKTDIALYANKGTLTLTDSRVTDANKSTTLKTVLLTEILGLSRLVSIGITPIPDDIFYNPSVQLTISAGICRLYEAANTAWHNTLNFAIIRSVIKNGVTYSVPDYVKLLPVRLPYEAFLYNGLPEIAGITEIVNNGIEVSNNYNVVGNVVEGQYLNFITPTARVESPLLDSEGYFYIVNYCKATTNGYAPLVDAAMPILYTGNTNLEKHYTGADEIPYGSYAMLTINAITGKYKIVAIFPVVDAI